jgi:two-component system phosphate regulon sensor histidine kinase PhoR
VREQQYQTEVAQQAQRLVELQDATSRIAVLQQDLTAARQTLVTSQADWEYKRALILTLANTASDGVMVLDNDRRIIAINLSAEVLFGRQRPIGETLLEVTNLPDLDMMVENAIINNEYELGEQVTIGKCIYRAGTRLIRRDGHTFIGLALQDITNLVRLNRARREMVANISHELRTPIANIRLIIDSLFHEDEKPKRKRSITSIQAIARETDSLLWIMQEMLDLSMIESGQAIVRMVEISLPDLVNDALERLIEQATTKGVTFANTLPEVLPVLGDWDQVRRVLVNLVHNAIKWSPQGGTVTIRVVCAADEVTVSVADEGPGVPEDQVDRIFERFYQVDSSRSGGEGTGLGLAICKHIVEAHGGRIWAENNTLVGGGLFRFTLALAGSAEIIETPAE